MDYPALVNIEFDKGGAVLSALEAAEIPVTVALWVQFPEYSDWRLVLAAKKLDPLDTGDAYGRILEALRAAGFTPWNTPGLYFMRTTDPFIRALRKSYRHVNLMAGSHLGGQTWGDRYVIDAYACRIA
ncbi:hypothetical protein [Silvibacterium sp.]|uniref:hypothetical protein n=1 Tax=Silvibacterium sp. TaxID=1964179 RepID=UPI0039E62AD7